MRTECRGLGTVGRGWQAVVRGMRCCLSPQPSVLGPHFTVLAFLISALSISGCSTVPATNIKPPLSARPAAPAAVAESGGAIFQARSGVSLFEDRRARRVGDTLVVNLVEKTSASRKTETTESRAASADLSVPRPTVLGRSPNAIGPTAWTADSSQSHAFKDNDSNSSAISGAITVTVVEVLDNGNLVVAGEKQIGINNDSDYIRLAGVVNPTHITAGNSVNSTQLADVQIESKNTQGIETAQMTSMLARFFLTLMPF